MSKTDAMIAVMRKTMRIMSLTLATPCAIALVAWVFLITAYILGRALFNVPWLFVEEFTEFWLIVIGYFAIAYALMWGRHVAVDFVTTWLPDRVRRGLRVATSLLALPIVMYLIWRAIEWFIKGYPFWPFYLVVVIGLSALFLGLLFETCLSVIGMAQGRDILFEEAEEYF